MKNRKTLLSWSSGKDSAWTLHLLRHDPDVDVVGLVTTVNEVHDRVAMHAVRVGLLRRQAAAVGVPLRLVPIPHPCSNEEYEAAMGALIKEALAEGIETMAFGDLFLEDIRAYRESRLKDTGMTPIFPIWGLPTDDLARNMVEAGLRARVTCVDPKQMPREFAGRVFDRDFLKDLPDSVDPCGERGEFHSFAFDGPVFAEPVGVTLGEIVERDGFVFADLMPADAPSA